MKKHDQGSSDYAEPYIDPDQDSRNAEAVDAKATGSSHKGLLYALLVICLLVILGVVGVFGYIFVRVSPYADYDKIMPNVYCAGADLSGMDELEARRAIESALETPTYSVTVTIDGNTFTFCPTQSCDIQNIGDLAEAAYNYMREDTSAYGMYRAYQRAQKTEYHINAEASYSYSRDDIRATAEQAAEIVSVSPTESSATVDNDAHTVTVTVGQAGRTIDASVITEAVCAAFDSMDFSDITLETESVPVDLDQLAAVCTEAVEEGSYDSVPPVVTADTDAHLIHVTAGLPGYTGDAQALYSSAQEAAAQNSAGPCTLTLTEVPPASPDISSAVEEVSCDVLEPYYYNGEVYEGQNGYYVDETTSTSLLLGLAYGDSVDIPTVETYPEKTADEVRAVLFRDTLGSYSSPHTSDSNRTTNLVLACEAINGTVINPGETFSFNGTVGERTAEKGYKEGTVYVGTESKGEVGGGICQVASTIYMAVLYADLEVTVRSPHVFLVTYVPGGLDATVYWGAQDFCFRNDTDYPVRVNASVSGGYVHISLDGTDVNYYTVELTSECLETTPYETKTTRTAEKPAGYYEYISPYTGYKYEAYQNIYDQSGNLVESNYLGISEYEKRDEEYVYGTG